MAVNSSLPTPEPGRRKPAGGVRVEIGRPTIVFVPVCTKARHPWLAYEEAHQLLREAWRQAETWLVGNYILMPDHLHLFAAPRDLRFTIEQWLAFWKSRFSKADQHEDWVWQAHAFHHRLRDEENYAQKWRHVRENPARKGLVADPDAWPYQGVVHVLRW